MQVSLEEAIHIHAKALAARKRQKAPAIAREEAERLLRIGDLEGHQVWMAVAEKSLLLLHSDELKVPQ